MSNHPKCQSPRLTIGFLLHEIKHESACALWRGVVDLAQEQDVNLITFVGWAANEPIGFRSQASVIYDLVSAERVDGLIIDAAYVAGYMDDEEQEKFYQGFGSLPIVNMEKDVRDLPSVDQDSYHGTRTLMDHLIEEHDYHRIAFIRGPYNHPGANERYQAYCDVLVERGLPFDQNLITPSAPWDPSTGRAGIDLLLDERAVDFDAVIGANDEIAIAAMEALQIRGIRIPADVAVAGVDDFAESKWLAPPLTTLRYPAYQLGRRGTELLLARLRSEAVTGRDVIPMALVIRQSCGCPDPMVTQAAVKLDREDSGVLAKPLEDQEEETLETMRQVAEAADLDSAWLTQLLAAFMADLAQDAADEDDVFLQTLETGLRQSAAAGNNIGDWQNVISALRSHLLPGFRDDGLYAQALDLCQQARTMISTRAERRKTYQAFQAEQQAEFLREIGTSLITALDVEELVNVLARELPQLGIPSFYLSLYADPQKPTELSELVLAYNEHGRIALENGKQLFPSSYLVPDNILPDERRYNLVVQPLYFRENQLGFALFEAELSEGLIYEELRGQISTALRGAFLVEQQEKHSRQLQTVAEVSTEASTSLLDTTKLLQRVVDLTKESFGLYHVHLYLTNEAGDTLVLAAGAGEVGKKMVTDSWQISLNAEQSLVAQAAQTRQGRMVNNVRENPNWLPNSLLPDTCAELAVPLIAGKRLLGVLDVQSDEVNHFTDDDIQVQGTLAAQVAVTLENAKLFERLDQANAEIKILNERLQEENVRMMAELNVAQQLQEMLLPKPEELQHIEGMDIAGYMKPADEVGGDYYDVLEHNGRVKIGIGDVTGHGLESGVVMLMLQTAVRTLLTSDITDPIRFMDILNRAIHKNIERMNVDKSLSLALVDYVTSPTGQMGEMRLSGQHEQLIVVRKGGQIELQDTSDLGFPVGLIADIGELVSELSINLESGDGIVLYSDGITEAENKAREFYGLERLCQVISQHWPQRADAIKQAVVDDVQAYIGEQTVYDDITLLIVKQK